VQVSIELSGFKEVVELLDVFQRTHVKFALQESLNKGLAPALREYERGHIERTFNDPVPLTLKAPITTEWANFNSLQINFKHIDQISGGTSPSVYLRPQVTGGQVNVTRLNRALQATGFDRQQPVPVVVGKWTWARSSVKDDGGIRPAD
jgi:hypothetical protein